jgi:predicted CoA-binding protein
MTTKKAVDDFLAQKKLAVVGVSRSGKKFSNMAFKELKAKGYQLFPVNPHGENIEGQRCYPTLTALDEKVGGAVVIVPPAEAEKVVKDAAQAGIGRVWLQQGAETQGAIKFCQDNGIDVIHNECVLMFAEPAAIHHRLHRWIWKLLGKLPA